MSTEKNKGFRARRSGSMIASVIAAAVAAFSVSPAAAQQYPTKPITLVVPFPAGALADIAARLLQEPLRESLGQPIVVENRGGAGGTTGSAFVARAQPDGYTLLLTINGTLTVNPYLQKSYPFDPKKDLASVALIAETPLALAVHKDLPVKTVADFIAYAKANPGKVSFGTAGMGSTHHLAGELLNKKAGLDMTAVHYRGGGAAATDLVAGHIPTAFGTLVTLNAFAQQDSVRIIALTEGKRDPQVPNVPTIAETIPDLVLTTWVGMSAPAGTPQPIIDQVSKAVTDALKRPAVIEKLKAQFATVVTGTPKEMTARIESELDYHKKAVELTGLKAQ